MAVRVTATRRSSCFNPISRWSGPGLETSCRKTDPTRGNLIYSPVTALDLGAELSLGERELENGQSGDVTRLTFFAKYGF